MRHFQVDHLFILIIIIIYYFFFIISEALVNAVDFVADLASSPGKFNGDTFSISLVQFTVTAQKALLASIEELGISGSLEISGFSWESEVPGQGQLWFGWRIVNQSFFIARQLMVD